MRTHQTTPPAGGGSRIDFLDPLRGILMALGVLLHSAQVFNPAHTWLVYSDDTTPVAGHLIAAIHMFRLPAFFIIAGFFALLVIEKRGPAAFLKSRAERILIPFVATALLLNTSEGALLTATGWSDKAAHAFENRGWVSHLWFLAYLFAYVVPTYAVAALWKYLPKSSHIAPQRRASAILPVLVMLALPASFLGILTFGKLVPALYDWRIGFVVPYDLLYYAQFFCWGLALRWKKALFEGYTRFSLTTIVLCIAWALAGALADDVPQSLAPLVEAYFSASSVWLVCHAIFATFRSLATQSTVVGRFAASASYTIYLFHHILVVAFGMLFVEWGLGGELGLVLLACTVLVSASLIHIAFVSRSAVASYLFNGVRLDRRKDRPGFVYQGPERRQPAIAALQAAQLSLNQPSRLHETA